MSKTCLTSIWHQIPRLFGLICVQNSVGSLVLYNGLNFTQKSVVILLYLSQNPQLYSFASIA